MATSGFDPSNKTGGGKEAGCDWTEWKGSEAGPYESVKTSLLFPDARLLVGGDSLPAVHASALTKRTVSARQYAGIVRQECECVREFCELAKSNLSFVSQLPEGKKEMYSKSLCFVAARVIENNPRDNFLQGLQLYYEAGRLYDFNGFPNYMAGKICMTLASSTTDEAARDKYYVYAEQRFNDSVASNKPNKPKPGERKAARLNLGLLQKRTLIKNDVHPTTPSARNIQEKLVIYMEGLVEEPDYLGAYYLAKIYAEGHLGDRDSEFVRTRVEALLRKAAQGLGDNDRRKAKSFFYIGRMAFDRKEWLKAKDNLVKAFNLVESLRVTWVKSREICTKLYRILLKSWDRKDDSLDPLPELAIPASEKQKYDQFFRGQGVDLYTARLEECVGVRRRSDPTLGNVPLQSNIEGVSKVGHVEAAKKRFRVQSKGVDSTRVAGGSVKGGYDACQFIAAQCAATYGAAIYDYVRLRPAVNAWDDDQNRRKKTSMGTDVQQVASHYDTHANFFRKNVKGKRSSVSSEGDWCEDAWDGHQFFDVTAQRFFNLGQSLIFGGSGDDEEGRHTSAIENSVAYEMLDNALYGIVTPDQLPADSLKGGGPHGHT